MTDSRKIMIIDEHGFSRVCSAILEDIIGFKTDILTDPRDLSSKLNANAISLIVTSYPFRMDCIDEIKKSGIPTIILSDSLDSELLRVLRELEDSYCLIKPLDYDHFRSLVTKVVRGRLDSAGPGVANA